MEPLDGVEDLGLRVVTRTVEGLSGSALACNISLAPTVPTQSMSASDFPGFNQSPTMCPTNYYAVGINWWGASATIYYCIGCLSGIQVVRAKLNAKYYIVN